jgi:hypothetical protein
MQIDFDRMGGACRRHSDTDFGAREWRRPRDGAVFQSVVGRSENGQAPSGTALVMTDALIRSWFMSLFLADKSINR